MGYLQMVYLSGEKNDSQLYNIGGMANIKPASMW